MNTVLLPRRRPFRFGLQANLPPGGLTGEPDDAHRWRELAGRVEDLGYAILTVADHLDAQLATIPAIVAAADATTTLRVGALVLANDYRHPVVLAKEAATVDLLSGGRFELGLGAGWRRSDYAIAGLPYDPHGVRIDHLAEAVAVIKGLFGEGPATFEGAHCRVDGLEGFPKPVQRPGPPLVMGGGGKRMLSLAGREADIVGINPSLAAGVIDATAGPTTTAEATDQKLRWIAGAAGRRYQELELQVRIHRTAITDDRSNFARHVAPEMGLTPEEVLKSPHVLVGTVTEIVEQCLERRERFGLSYITVSVDALDAFAPVVEHLAGK